MNVGSGLIACCNFPKFQSPKTRRWRQKLYPNPLSFFARLALVDDAALLIFQRFRVRQNQHLAVVNFVLQEQQPAVCVDHHGLASLLELLSIVRAALRLHSHLVKRSSAAPPQGCRCLAHTIIIGRFTKYRKLANRTGVPHLQPPASQRPGTFLLRVARFQDPMRRIGLPH